jgi:uncharacterized membrane protein YozB (DUF420 family)
MNDLLKAQSSKEKERKVANILYISIIATVIIAAVLFFSGGVKDPSIHKLPNTNSMMNPK